MTVAGSLGSSPGVDVGLLVYYRDKEPYEIWGKVCCRRLVWASRALQTCLPGQSLCFEGAINILGTQSGKFHHHQSGGHLTY